MKMYPFSETTGKKEKKSWENHLRIDYQRPRRVSWWDLSVPTPPLPEDLQKRPYQHLQAAPQLLHHPLPAESPPTHLGRSFQDFLSLPSRDLLLAATGRSLWVWKMGVLLTGKNNKNQKNKNHNKLVFYMKRYPRSEWRIQRMIQRACMRCASCAPMGWEGVLRKRQGTRRA